LIGREEEEKWRRLGGLAENWKVSVWEFEDLL
jgi:hypothetical protein